MRTLSVTECHLHDIMGDGENRRNIEAALKGERSEDLFCIADPWWSESRGVAHIYFKDAKLLLRYLKMPIDAQQAFLFRIRAAMKDQRSQTLDVEVEWGPESKRRIRAEDAGNRANLQHGEGDLRFFLI